MYFTIFDLVLILIVFLFISFGFALGLIQTIGALVGVVLGTWVAGLYYEPVAGWIEPIVLGNANLAKVIAFVGVFVIINRLVGLAFWFINKVFKLVSIIPFTKSLNRLLGAIFGAVEGVLVIGISLYFISRTPVADWFSGVIGGSNVALFMIEVGSWLAPLLPAALRLIQPVF